MLFFGWGTNQKYWPLSNGKKVMASWSYFSLFFSPLAYNIKWILVGDNRQEDQLITYDKVKELFPIDTPRLNLWQRYGLVILLLGFWVISKL